MGNPKHFTHRVGPCQKPGRDHWCRLHRRIAGIAYCTRHIVQDQIDGQMAHEPVFELHVSQIDELGKGKVILEIVRLQIHYLNN